MASGRLREMDYMNKEYSSPFIDSGEMKRLLNQQFCPSPNAGLSYALRHGNYDDFIKIMGRELRMKGYKGIMNLNIRVECDGQCPKGCEKKFKMKLGKSITKTKFNKIYNHGIKYPEHCIILKYEADIEGFE